MKVIASKIENLTDARYFAAQGVEYLGFDLTKIEENQTKYHSIHAIKEWVEGVQFVGEYQFPKPALLNDQIVDFGLQVVQISQFDNPSLLKDLPPSITPWQSFVIDQKEAFFEMVPIILKNSEWIDCFVLDFQFELPTTTPIDYSNLLSNLDRLCQETSIFLSTPFEASKVSYFMDNFQLEGIQVKGGLEEKVGFKSFDALDEIFEEIENWVQG